MHLLHAHYCAALRFCTQSQTFLIAPLKDLKQGEKARLSPEGTKSTYGSSIDSSLFFLFLPKPFDLLQQGKHKCY